MVWVKPELLQVFFPGRRDELEGCEAFECLETLVEVVGFREGFQVGAKVVARLVVASLERGVLQGPVHALELAVQSRTSLLAPLARPKRSAIGSRRPSLSPAESTANFPNQDGRVLANTS